MPNLKLVKDKTVDEVYYSTDGTAPDEYNNYGKRYSNN